MVNTPEKTEEKIIAAAKRVFIKKGMDGARMQEIADEAGINKSLLHYYFRSKDKLFEEVFSDSFQQVIMTVKLVLDNADSVDSFVEKFVKNYIGIIRENPIIPQFVIHELNRNPERIVKQMQKSDFDPEKLFGLIMGETKTNHMSAFDPMHLVVNLLAMCIFPFIARPIIQGFLFGGDEDLFENFIDERIEHITAFVKQAVLLK